VPGTDIFLSYARHDRDIARIFAKAIDDEGFSVWWDASLHSGETFDEVIEQNLRDAKAVVVLWSPHSVASRWVRAEATQADRRNKLAPAIIEPCDRPIIFELTHAADLSHWAGDISDLHWRTFMDDLRRLVDRNVDAESPAASRRAVDPPRSRTIDVEERPGPAPMARRPLKPGNYDILPASRPYQQSPHRQPNACELRPANIDPADPDQEVHCLELEGDELGEDLFVVDSSGLKIGRSAPAHIVLSHKSVSREHCIVGLANDELLVTDLNSTNGTYIDGQRVSRATILPVGSVIRLGQVSLRHAVRKQADAARRHGPPSGIDPRGLEQGRLAATS
jgi:hypothetical protein